MSEYWKSTAKKYCQICKVWFADNKVSVENHERGPKHIAMVQQRLREGAKKAKDKERETNDLNHTLIMMEQAARASMSKPEKAASIPTYMRPSIMQPSYSADILSIEQQIAKLQPPQQKSNKTEPKKWTRPIKMPDYSGPPPNVDYNQFEPSAYSFEKDQQRKRKLESETPEPEKLQEIRPIVLVDQVEEEEKKDEYIETSKSNKKQKQRRPQTVPKYNDDGPRIGAWVPVVKKPEVIMPPIEDLSEQKTETEVVEEMLHDPQELLFKEKVLPVEPKTKKTKTVEFKKRNLGNKSLRVRSEQD